MACRASRTSWADSLAHVLHAKEPGVLAHRMPPGHAETHRPPLAVSTHGLKRLSPSLRAVSSHCSRGTWLHQVGGLTSRMPASHAQCLVSLAPAIPRGPCTRRVHSLGLGANDVTCAGELRENELLISVLTTTDLLRFVRVSRCRAEVRAPSAAPRREYH